MSSTPQQPFIRYTHPDPGVQRIVQDIYDKLAAIQRQLSLMQSQIDRLTPPSP